MSGDVVTALNEWNSPTRRANTPTISRRFYVSLLLSTTCRLNKQSKQRDEIVGLKECPDCGATVSTNANTCPGCGSRRVQPFWHNRRIGCMFIGLIFLIPCLWLNICGESSLVDSKAEEDESTKPIRNSTAKPFDPRDYATEDEESSIAKPSFEESATDFCKNLAKKEMKVPGSAKFEFMHQARSVGKGVYIYNAYVDVTEVDSDGFKGKIRRDVHCRVKCSAASSCDLIEFNMK